MRPRTGMGLPQGLRRCAVQRAHYRAAERNPGRGPQRKPRMPAILCEADHDGWLRGTAGEAKAALVPYPTDGMDACQVSRRLYASKTPVDASLIELVAAPFPL